MSDLWQAKHAKLVVENLHVHVEETEWDTPKRKGVRWLTVYHNVAVVIAPRTADGHHLLICEERPAIRQTLWTLPAAQVDVAPADIRGEAFIETRQRELPGEAGQQAEHVKILGHYHSSPGFTNERLYLLLADQITASKGGARPKETECTLDQRLVTADGLRARVLSNELQDGPSLAMCAQLGARGHLS